MTTYCVAYKSHYTTAIARSRLDPKSGWERISGFISFTEAKQLFELRKDELTNSAVAIFASVESSTTPWFARCPCYIANQHVINKNAPLAPFLAGLINSKSSDWF